CVGAFDSGDSLTALEVHGETLLVPGRIGETGSPRRVRIAATDISLAVERPSQTTIVNIIPVRVKDIAPLDGAQLNVVLAIGHPDGGPRLLARVTRRAQRVLGFGPGQDVYAQIKAVSLIASSDEMAPARRNVLPEGRAGDEPDRRGSACGSQAP